MINRYPVIHITLLCLSLFGPVSAALADTDYLEAQRLLESGKILPLEDILAIVKKAVPGRLLEIELETKDSQVIYEVEILNANGVVKEVYINASSGEIISTKDDD